MSRYVMLCNVMLCYVISCYVIDGVSWTKMTELKTMLEIRIRNKTGSYLDPHSGSELQVNKKMIEFSCLHESTNIELYKAE